MVSRPVWLRPNVNNDNGTSNLLAFLSTVRIISVAAVSLLLNILCCFYSLKIFLLLLTFFTAYFRYPVSHK